MTFGGEGIIPSRRMKLADLFNRYGTDKDQIGYTPVYEALFDRRRGTIRSFLEVGIGTLLPGAHSSMLGFALDGYRPGGSLRAWRDYFPACAVHGMDVAADTQFGEERITTHRCDSTETADVQALFGRLGAVEFDVVVDDGSHVDDDQLATLENLYPYVRDGGYYVIEDVNPESAFRTDPGLLRARCNGDPFFFAGSGTTLCVIRKTTSASGARAESSARRETTAAILMYHRVNDLAVDPHRLCVPPAEFREHMRHLAERRPVVSLDRLARGVLDGTLPRGAVAVTFDDGTLDALESASPVLTELDIPATFFINVEHIDEEHEPWWDVLARILLDRNETPAVLDWTLDGSRRTLSTGNASEREAAYAAIHPALMHATRPERERVLADLVEWAGEHLPVRASHRLLLPHEVRELGERPGHTIGAHSVSHIRLPLQPAEEQDWEIGTSRRELERITGRPVTLFSYPYGGHDRDTVERVRRAGFRAAVTTEPRVVTIGDDVRALPRIEVKSGGVADLARALDEALCRH